MILYVCVFCYFLLFVANKLSLCCACGQITLPALDSGVNIDWLFGVYTCHATNYFGRKRVSWEFRKAGQ